MYKMTVVIGKSQKLLISFIDFGMGNDITAEIFSGSGEIPSADTTKPRQFTEAFAK